MPKLEITSREEITTSIIYTVEEFKSILPKGTDFYERYGCLKWTYPDGITKNDLEELINKDVKKNFGEDIGDIVHEWTCELQCVDNELPTGDNYVPAQRSIVRIMFYYKDHKYNIVKTKEA